MPGSFSTRPDRAKLPTPSPPAVTTTVLNLAASLAKVQDLDPTSSRAVAEYLSVLDDAAFGGATPVEPKAISPTDPAARYTAAADKPAVYAYSDNYLIDLKHAVIMDVEATTAIRQAEVGAAKTMLDRTAEQFEVAPSRLVADACCKPLESTCTPSPTRNYCAG